MEFTITIQNLPAAVKSSFLCVCSLSFELCGAFPGNRENEWLVNFRNEFYMNVNIWVHQHTTVFIITKFLSKVNNCFLENLVLKLSWQRKLANVESLKADVLSIWPLRNGFWNSQEFLGIKVWIFTVNSDWEFLGIPNHNNSGSKNLEIPRNS